MRDRKIGLMQKRFNPSSKEYNPAVIELTDKAHVKVEKSWR